MKRYKKARLDGCMFKQMLKVFYFLIIAAFRLLRRTMLPLRISLYILIYFSFGSASANEKIFSWNLTERSGDIRRISQIVERTNQVNENLSRTEITTILINCLKLQTATNEKKTIKGSGNSEEFVRFLKEQLPDLSDFTTYPPKQIRTQLLSIDSDQYKDICKGGGVQNFGIEVIWNTLEQNIKKWETSSEYKNEVNTNIAKLKKAEDDKRAEGERVRAAEESKKLRVKQQCEKMKNWATDSPELIAAALKTSISSVRLIRFQMGQWRCLATVDTPKGPEKCVVMQILQDKKSGEYFADMGGPFAVQAVCGGMAF